MSDIKTTGTYSALAGALLTVLSMVFHFTLPAADMAAGVMLLAPALHGIANIVSRVTSKVP